MLRGVILSRPRGGQGKSLLRQREGPAPFADNEISYRAGPGGPGDIDKEVAGRVGHKLDDDRMWLVPFAKRGLKDRMAKPIPAGFYGHLSGPFGTVEGGMGRCYRLRNCRGNRRSASAPFGIIDVSVPGSFARAD